MRDLEIGDIVQLLKSYRHIDKFSYGRALIDAVDEKGYAKSKGCIIHKSNVSILYDNEGAMLSKDKPVQVEMVTIPKELYQLMIRIVDTHLG